MAEGQLFTKILIANRGEIACRVIESARAMGIATVAVHSDVDAEARHVALADEAVSLGGARPDESYLRGDAIIAAARATGAQAVHPGYGFLSENPDFVEALEDAGLVFIGPSAKAIRSMGLKGAAKALMEEAGVPVVPGYHGAEQSEAHLAAEAERIGYPVLLKAVAGGGGGKGMRRVDAPAAFSEALAAAKAEAKGAFGNDEMLVEKYILSPRHVEVQVFGDGTRAVHLFERDCSLQRRHQKVIEEAPAPGMSDEVRAAMTGAAVRAAEAIGYKGAGTIEFIADGSEGLRADGFWFMGNEHPPAGGTSRDRGDHRGQFGRMADPRGGGRTSALRPGGPGDPGPCGRGAALRRGCRRRFPARHRTAGPAGLSREPARRYRRARGGMRSARITTR